MDKETKKLTVLGVNKLYPLRIEKIGSGIAFTVGNVMTGCTGMVLDKKDLHLVIDFLKYLEKEIKSN